MQDRKRFGAAMAALSEKYEKNLSEFFTEAVWAMLEPYPDDQCAAAFNHVFKYGRFWKDLNADLMEFLEGRDPESIDAAKAKANEQADNILSLISAKGSDRALRFVEDQITKRLMSSRWAASDIGRMAQEATRWWRKEFIEAYIAEKWNAQIPVTYKQKDEVTTNANQKWLL